MQAAPFYNDVADGPEGAAAYWLTAADGVQLRIGVWGAGDKGTVLLLPGRTEYIEKYGRAAEDLHQRGYATVSVDWRGQGLASRLLPDRMPGHVGTFSDYQLDMAAVMAALPGLNLPQPLFLIAHSMGGCIALRALMGGLDVRSAVFTGPMWTIRMPAVVRPVVRGITGFADMAGLGHRYVPGTSCGVTYVEAIAFEKNELTTDPGMYGYLQAQAAAHPDLVIGGPTLHWLGAAMRENRDLARRPAPATPALTVMGGDETIVSREVIKARMARWPGGTLLDVPGVRHEIMMEKPADRAQFFDKACAFFAG